MIPSRRACELGRSGLKIAGLSIGHKLPGSGNPSWFSIEGLGDGA